MTFNGLMDYDVKGVRGFILRALHVHMVGVLRARLAASFRWCLNTFGHLDLLLPTVMKLIAYDVAVNRGVDAAAVVPVLLLDEIRLAGDTDAEIKAVYGAATVGLQSYRAIISSLDYTTVASARGMSAHSGSGKPVTWLPLPRLSSAPFQTMTDNRLVKRLIAMAAGHPPRSSLCSMLHHALWAVTSRRTSLT